jgi:hypothetical protein
LATFMVPSTAHKGGTSIRINEPLVLGLKIKPRKPNKYQKKLLTRLSSSR